MLVYFFGSGTADGTREMKAVLGGKGANLAEMTNLGVPVPPGFTIACSACIDYLDAAASTPTQLRAEVERQPRAPRAGDREAASAIRRIRCSSPCAPARRCRCPE